MSSVPAARLLSRSRAKISWTKKLADHRMAGIKKWVALIEKYPDAFQCGRQVSPGLPCVPIRSVVGWVGGWVSWWRCDCKLVVGDALGFLDC